MELRPRGLRVQQPKEISFVFQVRGKHTLNAGYLQFPKSAVCLCSHPVALGLHALGSDV